MADKNLSTTSNIGKHTPGPWYATGEHVQSYVLDEDGYVCDAEGDTPQQSHANAQLIAAAPELLQALRQCLEQMDYLRRNLSPAKSRFTAPTTNAAEELAINAISKALGGAQ